MVNVCGDCKKRLVRWESARPDETCPRAEYKSSEENRIACLPTDSACEHFEQKQKARMVSNFSWKPFNADRKFLIVGEDRHVINTEYILEYFDTEFHFKSPIDLEELLVYEDGCYVAGEWFVKHILEKEYDKYLRKHYASEIVEHIKRANPIKRDQINQFHKSIPIANGLFNLETRELEPFDPERVFTYKLNVEYNPEATCPKWLEFVKQVVSEDDIPLLQEILGYCLLPAMPLHKLFWLYGPGRNGKGVVMRTLEAVFGKDNVSNLNLSEFTERRRFSLQKLYRAFLCVCSEPKLSQYGLQTTVLKMVTGQDTIDAELKGKNKRLKFVNHAKIFILGNHFPKVSDNSLGWWDRVVVLNFPNSFDGDNKILDIENHWIPDELSGIFSWMLDGLDRLYINREFSGSKSTEETKTEFMKVSDPFNAWKIENCLLIPKTYTIREDAYIDFQVYCDDIGVEPCSKRTFFEKVRQVSKVRDTKKRMGDKTPRVFEGLTLKSVALVADVAGSTYPLENFESNKIEDKKSATNATNATKEATFFTHCSLCKTVLAEGENHTTFDGKPVCANCLNTTKKGPWEDDM